jgi:hypothetical protein
MGLMDRVKAQATELAQQGKAKYDQVQATRRADAMLRNLGAVVYQERTGRGAPDSQAQIDKLVADLSAHEAANGINLSPEPTGQPGSPGTGQPGSPGAGQPWSPGAGQPGSPGAGQPWSPGAGQAGSPGTGQPQGGGAGPSTSFPPEAGTTTQV